MKFPAFSIFIFVIGCQLFSVNSQGQMLQKGTEGDQSELPQYFSLRNSGFLSPVRSQPTGGCWASSALISIESAWRKSGEGDFLLSDKNLQLFHGFSQNRNTYGNHYMVTAYLSRWSGPVLYSPFADSMPASPEDLPIHITEARYLANNPPIIKEALMNLGPVYSMMYFRKSGLDTLNAIYYAPQSKINHAVALVGWNDTLKTREGQGAWIAQNSLGVDFADSGFFYIPYQDKNILEYNAVWPKWERNLNHSKLYYYDTLGSFDSYGFGDSVCFGLVKFTCEKTGKLTRVASFINKPNSTIQFSVFEKFDENKHVLSGEIGQTARSDLRDAGYYTLDLNQEVALNAGQDFYVMARYCTPADTLPLPVESYIRDYADPHIQSGKCWINPDYDKWPTSWYACGKDVEYSFLNFDLNIRAIVMEE